MLQLYINDQLVINYNVSRQPCLMLVVLQPQYDTFGIIFYNKDEHFLKNFSAPQVNSFAMVHWIQIEGLSMYNFIIPCSPSHVIVPKYSLRWTDCVTTLLDELGWPILSKKRKDARLILFYKIINNLAQVPHE